MSKDLIVQEQPTPAHLMQIAIEKGVDIQQLEKLMDLQDRWEKKEARKAFLDALSRFQTIVPQLRKGKTAKIQSQKGFFSYKYADLGSITSSIKNALNECGLSYRWEFNETGEKMKVTCLISHRDGHSETTSMEAGRDSSGAKNDIQQKGSTHTYLQRYTLIGALGLSTADEDNDAKGAPQKEQTEEEYLDQWNQAVSQAKTRIELNTLYLKNKKTIEVDVNIQKMFKDRESVLKAQSNGSPAKVEMP
jgi:hypothetical protein